MCILAHIWLVTAGNRHACLLQSRPDVCSCAQSCQGGLLRAATNHSDAQMQLLHVIKLYPHSKLSPLQLLQLLPAAAAARLGRAPVSAPPCCTPPRPPPRLQIAAHLCRAAAAAGGTKSKANAPGNRRCARLCQVLPAASSHQAPPRQTLVAVNPSAARLRMHMQNVYHSLVAALTATQQCSQQPQALQW